jgi:hypothetical protein
VNFNLQGPNMSTLTILINTLNGMPNILGWILTLLLCFSNTIIEADLTIISLGSDCQVADNLKAFHLRKEAYPFDWIVTEDFESVIDAIQDDFAHWLDPNYLEYRGTNIYNKCYNLAFVHDFPIAGHSEHADGDYMAFGQIDSNYLTFLPSATDKFNRRVQRLYQLFITNSPIIFVRAHANRKSAERFVSVIKGKYPNLPFVLLVVTRAGLLNPPWNLPHVVNVYVSDEGGQLFPWWWSRATWYSILKQYNLLS